MRLKSLKRMLQAFLFLDLSRYLEVFDPFNLQCGGEFFYVMNRILP
jgi:hypothetical protein